MSMLPDVTSSLASVLKPTIERPRAMPAWNGRFAVTHSNCTLWPPSAAKALVISASVSPACFEFHAPGPMRTVMGPVTVAARSRMVLPVDVKEMCIDFLAERFAGRADVPVTTLDAGDGRVRTTGGAGSGPVEVQGPAADLLGWLCGRRDGTALTVRGGPLPALPPL